MSLDAQTAARSRVPLLLAVGGFVLLGIGIAIGVVMARSGGGGWREGTGHIGVRQVTVDVGDWTYGASGAVPAWIDRLGTRHDSGWPACLKGRPGTNRTVRFLAPTVAYDHGSFRPIVVVDCRA